VFFTLPLAVACARVVSSDDDSGADHDSSGGTRSLQSGGTANKPSSSGGNVVANGASSTGDPGGMAGARPDGGGTSTGGISGGGGTTEDPPVLYGGECDDAASIRDAGIETGDYAVFSCMLVQAACTKELFGEPALWECVDSHSNNCITQDPTGGAAWSFVALCSDLSGAGGASMGGSAGAMP
jgi:hypothetical protein